MIRDITRAVLAGALVLAGAATAQDGVIVDRYRADRAPPTVAEATGPTASTPSVEPFVVADVRVEGSSLTAAEIEAATAPFVGRAIDVQGLVRLRDAVTQAAGRGRAALPFVVFTDGDFSQGIVRLTVLEARIDKVAIYGEAGGDVDLMRWYAARLAAETPLSRRTAERYFSLIADIPGVTTTLQTVPSATPGAIDLGLELKRERWRHDFGLNTRGSSTLGRTQLQATSTLYGLFRMGDETRFSLLVPTDLERFQYLAISHRMALGSDGAALTGSLGYLRTRPDNSPVEGEATNASLTASWPWIRSYQTNLVLSAGLDGVDSTNAVFGEQIASENTRVVRLAAAFSRATPRRVVSLSGSVSQGLDGLGAEAGAFTDIAFIKANLRADLTQAIGRSWRLGGGGTVQVSDDRLPVTEQFTLGGADFGRGFSSALATGDSGWAVKAEAAWRPERLPAPIRGSEAYVFADGGEVEINARAGVPGARLSLASAGLGTRVALREKTVIEVEGARTLDDPRPGREGSWRLSVGVSTQF
jgi:hemolysin activation/secretion protein